MGYNAPGGSSSSSLVQRYLPGRGIGLPGAAYESPANYGSTVLGDTFRQPFVVTQQASDLSVLYGNWQSGGTNSITISASIEVTNNGEVVQLFAPNGATTVTIPPNSNVVMSAAGIDIAAGATIYIRTWVSVPIAGNAVPGLYRAGAGTGMWHFVGADQTMAVGTPAGTINDFTIWYGPAAILAQSVVSSIPYVAGIGDSIMAGQGDNRPTGGWLERVSATASLSHLNIAVAGSKLDSSSVGWTDQFFASMKRQLINNCTSAIVMLGINDFGGSTVPTMVTNLQAISTWLKNRGIKKVIACTLTPKTTSTDSWATTANQTAVANESVRQGYNTAIRAGISGIDAFFETALAVEVNSANVPTLNGGFWAVNGTASFMTADGLHPSPTGHGLIAATIQTNQFV